MLQVGHTNIHSEARLTVPDIFLRDTNMVYLLHTHMYVCVFSSVRPTLFLESVRRKKGLLSTKKGHVRDITPRHLLVSEIGIGKTKLEHR